MCDGCKRGRSVSGESLQSTVVAWKGAQKSLVHLLPFTSGGIHSAKSSQMAPIKNIEPSWIFNAEVGALGLVRSGKGAKGEAIIGGPKHVGTLER